MCTKLTCLALFQFLCFTAFSQTEDATNVAKVTLINPGLSYEQRIAKYQTLYAQAFMNTSAYVDEGGYAVSYKFYFDPAVTLQYRYYYNGAKRLEKDKRTDMNSMNYITLIGEIFYSKMPLTTSYPVEEEKRRAVNRLGVAWGLQRNFEKHFSVDLNLGLGVLYSRKTEYSPTMQKFSVAVSQPAFMGQLNIGFWFGGKK